MSCIGVTRFSGAGLFRLSGTQVVEITGPDGTSLGYVYVLTVDAEDRLWVGTLGRGLWREGRDGFEQVAAGPLEPRGNLTFIARSPDSTQILVAEDERLVMLDRSGLHKLLAAVHPLAGWSALWLDPLTVAVGSSEGLYLLDARDGTVRTQLNLVLGASAWEFTNNRALVRVGNHLYCGVNAGLLRVDLEKIAGLRRAPVLSLDELRWTDASPQLVDGTYELPSGKWVFEARLVAVWPLDERQVLYRYRLAGFDVDWTVASRAAVARYSSLPGGEYELWAQAVTPLTGFSEPVSLARIRVRPAPRPTGNSGVFALPASGPTAPDAAEVERLIVGQVAERTSELQRLNDDLATRLAGAEAAARTDPLTGVGNRRDLDVSFAIELLRAERTSSPLGVLMIDVDHFKLYNDAYGHQAGDDCLRAIALVLKKQLRPFDLVCRYGGEEFTVLLSGSSSQGATDAANRLCAAVTRCAMPHRASPLSQVTISIGATVCRAGPTEAVIRCADRALYQAKQQGRNRVVYETFA